MTDHTEPSDAEAATDGSAPWAADAWDAEAATDADRLAARADGTVDGGSGAPEQSSAQQVTRVTRLGVAGIVWGTLLSIGLVAGVWWVLVASSTDPSTELQRNGVGAVWVAVPALVGTLASVAGLVLGRRWARAGRRRPWLLALLALVLHALVTLGALALGAVAAAVVALTLS